MVIVTGGTGHIGNVLVKRLLELGESVRVVNRGPDRRGSLKGLDIEYVEADVRDQSALVSAFNGADEVYHLASIISIMPGGGRMLEAVNVGGTQNVINACQSNGIRRLVHCSSIHAFMEPPHHEVIDENTPIDPARVHGHYARTKAAATKLALAASSDSLEVVVVAPTGVMGPMDFGPSRIGQTFVDFARGKTPAYVAGSYDFVDNRDVVDGMIAAMKRGRPREAYLLSGEDISVKNMQAILAQHTGKKAPKIRIPYHIALIFSYFALVGYAISRPKVITFTPYAIRTLKSNSKVSSDKAKRELGFSARPLSESIKDSLDWFREQKVI